MRRSGIRQPARFKVGSSCGIPFNVADTHARLVPTSAEGNAARRPYALSGPRISIGRAPGNNLILRDPEVSKAHAEIVVENGAFVVRDLGSSNGTFVNGEAITFRRLEPGDEVEFGQSQFRFETGRESSKVTILSSGPIDQTRVIAQQEITPLMPGKTLDEEDALRAVYDQVRVAFEAVQDLIATAEPRQLCERVLDFTFRLVPAETGAILLYDTRRKLTPFASRSQDGASGNIVISRTVLDQVTTHHAAVLASDALRDQRWADAESVVLSGNRSLMCVPIVQGKTIYGVVHVGNASQVAAFGRSDLELMGGIGSGAGVVLANAFLAQRLAEEAKNRESLGRFLSPNVVEQVVNKRIDIKRGGVEKEVTVMFADIRGFTSLSERRSASDVVDMLNQYFDQMVEVVFQHHGTLDKFIGDALMAVWGSPVERKDDASLAIACARDMQSTLESLNAHRTASGEEPIEIGIGLASGNCVAGAMGARRRMEFTVVGDAVNLASRLSGVARGGEVLCDAATYYRAGRPVSEELPATKVKGKDKPVVIHRLLVEAFGG